MTTSEREIVEEWEARAAGWVRERAELREALRRVLPFARAYDAAQVLPVTARSCAVCEAISKAEALVGLPEGQP